MNEFSSHGDYEPPVEYGPPPATMTAGRALAEIAAVFAVLAVPMLIRSLIFGFGARRMAEQAGAWLYILVIINGLLVVAAIGVILYLDRRPWRSLGLHFDDVRGDIAAAVVALICIYGLMFVVGVAIEHLWPQVAHQVEAHRQEVARMFPRISPIAVVLFTLFVGFYEELFFRGFLITRLIALFRNVGAALVVSSLFFGALHFYQDPLAMFQIFVVAIVLGAIFLVRRSLIGPILVHFVFDFASLMTAIYYIQKAAK